MPEGSGVVSRTGSYLRPAHGVLMYTEHFGFRSLPFSSTPSPEFFYQNPVFQEALAYLQHGVQAGNGVILVTGEIGTGKTTLVRKFLRDMGSAVRPIHIMIGTKAPFFDMLRAALNDLGVATQSSDELEIAKKFKNYIRRSEQDGAATCLIMDEAQSLENGGFEELRRLLSSAESQGSVPQIFLIGEPELLNRLDRPAQRQLKQRVGLHCRLAPLVEGEIGRYIEFFVRSAGYPGDGLFDSAAVAAVAQYSRGIPRLVNKICDNALLEAYRRSQEMVDRKIVDEVARNLRLKQPQPAAQATAEGGAIEGKTSSPDWQIKSVWSSLQNKDEPAVVNVTGPRREGASRKVAGALLGLMTLGLAGLAMHFGTAGFAKLDDEPANGNALMSPSSSTRSGPSLDVHPAQQRASRGATSGKPSTGIFADGNIHSGAFSTSEITPLPKLSEPTPAANLEKSSVGTLRPDEFRQVKSPNPEPITQKRRVEIKVREAFRLRAIEGVSVTLVNQIAILRGQVASRRQKAMAERAALGVREVARVKNLIRIRP